MITTLFRPAESSFATERFFSITQATYIICLVAHLLMTLNFLYQGVIELVLLNIFFTVPIFLVALFFNNKRKIALAFLFVAVEFYFHQILSVYYLGWKSGFQYFLIFFAMIPFFYPNWSTSIKFLITSTTLFLFIVLLLSSTDFGIIQLPQEQYTISYVINSFLAGALLVLMMHRYVNNAASNESELKRLVNERTAELVSSQKAAIYMLGEAGHFHDDATGEHIWRMAMYSKALAIRLGWPEEEADRLGLAAAMHDTGKIGVPDEILKKPGKLSKNEWEIMQRHCQIGFNILSKNQSSLFKCAAEIALCHHEKWNGTGYPNGLAGKEIPETARIVAIADVFDALTMKRSYKKAWSVGEALEEIVKGREVHFDPNMVDCFVDMKEQIEAMRESRSAYIKGSNELVSR